MGLTLAIVNDHEVVVRGLAEMLRPFRSEVEIVQLGAHSVVTEPVDIALFDTFAQQDGHEVTVRELAENPLIGHVVVYTWNFDQALVQASIARGASGYLSKTLSGPELVEGLRKLATGERVISPDPGHADHAAGAWPGRDAGLTGRESEVLALIAQGLANTEIAEVTGLSINSIKSYIRSCYRKIGVANRSNAILWAVEHHFRADGEHHEVPEA